jgi:hypothetical protein
MAKNLILLKFREIGYARSDPILLSNLRNNQEFQTMNIRHFVNNMGYHSHGSIKYTSVDILGEKFKYYFDMDRKENFVDFLVKKFYEKNPNPEMGLKKAFTRLLHLNKLHWSEEYTGKKKVSL